MSGWLGVIGDDLPVFGFFTNFTGGAFGSASSSTARSSSCNLDVDALGAFFVVDFLGLAAKA